MKRRERKDIHGDIHLLGFYRNNLGNDSMILVDRE